MSTEVYILKPMLIDVQHDVDVCLDTNYLLETKTRKQAEFPGFSKLAKQLEFCNSLQVFFENISCTFNVL